MTQIYRSFLSAFLALATLAAGVSHATAQEATEAT